MAALVLVSVPTVWAEEPPPPIDPPQARLQPPGGFLDDARIQPPVGVIDDSRIQPPGGVSAESRLQPPVGAPEPGGQSLLDLFAAWLRDRAGALIQ